MTDKVQKIREEVERMHNLLPVMDGDNISVNYADRICTTLEMYIDSMQEEPISEDLEQAAKKYAMEEYPWQHGYESWDSPIKDFKAGAEWKEEQMTSKSK